MPSLSKIQVALKIQQNWLERNPEDMPVNDGSRTLDDSLTSLNWLHNLNIMGEISAPTPPTPPASPGPLIGNPSSGNCNYLVHGTSDSHCSAGVQDMDNVSLASLTSSSTVGRKNRPGVQSAPDNIDYKTNGDVKPPFSYANLICMAMRANKNKMSLSAIYKWIRENFMYYRRADAGWQNSIRHNLSLNKCFIKVPRNKDEPGKGGFWRLDPTYAEEMADGTFKKRRLSNRPTPKKTTKKDSGTIDAASSYFLSAPMQRSSSAQPHSTPLLTSIMVRPITTQASVGLNDNPGLPNDEESEASAAASSLKGDFCWNSVLNEDIEVDGMRYKTADIVDMDGVSTAAAELAATYRSHAQAINSSEQQQQQHHNHHHHQPPHHQHHQENAIVPCLSSPALSLDDDDLLVSDDASNDLSDTLDLTIHGTHIATSEWWRFTSTDSVSGSSISVADPQVPFSLTSLSNPAYDVAGAAAAFLGHGWDDSTRPGLDGSLDLENLIDLDAY